MFYSVWKSYKTQSIQPRFPSGLADRWVILIIDFLRREWGKRKENISFVNRNNALSIHSSNNKMRLKIYPLSQEMALCQMTWEPVIIIGYRHGLELWSGLESPLCILFSVFCSFEITGIVNVLFFAPKFHTAPFFGRLPAFLCHWGKRCLNKMHKY